MRELRERAEPALRILCLILAAVVVYELAGVIIRWNPFRGVVVPDLPALTSATNNAPTGPHGTNQVAKTGINGTNGAPHSSSTNSMPPLARASTNPVSSPVIAGKGTNLTAHLETPMTSTNGASNVTMGSLTNVVVLEQISSNPPIRVVTTSATTNVSALHIEKKSSGTNPAVTTLMATNSGTNLLAAAALGTNGGADSKPRARMAGSPPGMAGMGFNPFQPPGKSSIDLPPAVQSRISRITDSEILGPVMHPMPMALMGIAGQFAFLRSANGQTGLVKEGDSLDDLKLIRIGVNRVLIEQNGQKKELTIFSGYGSDSLLQNDSTNEKKHL